MNTNTAIDILLQSSAIAVMYKVLFTKQRSLGQIFSMDTLKEGGKIGVAAVSYEVAGRPIVRSVRTAVGGVVG